MQGESQIIDRIPVGISSCLLGEKVRFDSGHKRSLYITNSLSDYFDFRPFCPEVEIGLGIPREPIRLVRIGDDPAIRCVGTRTDTLDVTEQLDNIATAQFDWIAGMRGYIFKKDSPSCGMERVKVYRKNAPSKDGVGIYANRILQQFRHLPTEEEGRLGDPVLRENFIKRVFIYDRWMRLTSASFAKQDIIDFHTRHKLIFMSHNQNLTREIGQFLADIGDYSAEEVATEYLQRMTKILKKPANRKNHTNVLKHIQGYLKRDLESDDRQEMAAVIEDYRLGRLPIIVPITLLRHHFRKCPNDYIDRSFYMRPHPSELMLQNQL